MLYIFSSFNIQARFLFFFFFAYCLCIFDLKMLKSELLFPG